MGETDEGLPPALESPFSELDHAMMRLALDQALNAQLHGEEPFFLAFSLLVLS